ncbi:MAG: Unknown protein [uncultured Sulfurovum sp.]|uniref:Uncharacterized protein n=1 Tax=uncultured Sulfurovum sp. TaxID=269237 RepID=A0A6S6SMS9_9BACT|nr:MAG: Unknown protein [uncultured Sulfurovum sp.]
MGQGDPCGKIKEMIRKMQEQIRWRQGDLNQRSDSYRGHVQRIEILEKKISYLRGLIVMGWCK